MKSNLINVFFSNAEIALTDFDHEIWRQTDKVVLDKYWSGAAAPVTRRAEARIFWTNLSLFVRFDCPQGEPYVASENPNLSVEADQLWERDVCEIFLAPNAHEPKNYYEFEIAPTGEWLDFAIDFAGSERQTDRNYDSGMKTAALMGTDRFTVAMQINWSRAFGKTPTKNEVWRANLFRCVGATGNKRGYVAWQPTFTPAPNFHVPSAFGFLQFKREI